MHLFTDAKYQQDQAPHNGYWLIVAPDARVASAIASKFAGTQPQVEWLQVEDHEELTIRLHEVPITLTAREWVSEGQGLLAILEPVVWWLRGRDWISSTLDIEPGELQVGAN